MSFSSTSGGPSAPGGGGNGDRPGGGERRQSLTKFMTRAKSALKRDKAKRPSSSTDTAEEPTPLVSTIPEGPVGPTADRVPVVDAIPERKDGGSKESDAMASGPTKLDATIPTSRAAVQQEKARALFEKYGLTLEPHEWVSPTEVAGGIERVHKPIRMRVHRTCHRCQTTYGVDRVCVGCGHTRCRACPRYPVKKPKHSHGPAKAAGVVVIGDELVVDPSDDAAAVARKYRLSIPAKTETQDRVRKEIQQRTHRTCHRCRRQFERAGTTCDGCGHVRCTKCPRDPAKLDKYSNGYPGDVEAALEDDELASALTVKPRAFRKVRMPVRWYCHECDHLYLTGHKTCVSCEHRRCQDCRRVPSKKAKTVLELDPEVVKSVDAKLAALRISSLRKIDGGHGAVDHLVGDGASSSIAPTS